MMIKIMEDFYLRTGFNGLSLEEIESLTVGSSRASRQINPIDCPSEKSSDNGSPPEDDHCLEPIESLLFQNEDVSIKKKYLKSLDKIDCEQKLLSVTTDISILMKGRFSSCSTVIHEIRAILEIVKLLSELSPRTLTIVEMSFPDVIEFYVKALNVFDNSLRHASSKKWDELSAVDSLHFLLQTLLVVIEKSCSFKDVQREMMRKLYYALRRLLKYKQIPLNTTNNLGLVIVSLDYYYLELTSSIRLLKHSTNFAAKEHLALCYGFATVLPAELLLCPLESSTAHNDSLFTEILKSISSSYTKYPNDGIILTSCLKILCVMTQRISFSKNGISSDLMDFVISFLWSHLDHFQNIVKHLTRNCTSNLVAQKDDFCIDKFLELIKSSEKLDRRTCVLISCLNNKLGANCVLSHRPKLPSELLEAIKKEISPSYISQTFISLLVSSYYDIDLETWLEKWIEPLLSSDNVSNAHLSNALSEALKLSPRVADELLKFCRSANKRSYLNVVNCVLALNKLNSVNESLNETDEKPNQPLWRKKIPILFMTDAVRVPGSEEAVATINLILESCKKSAYFENEELILFQIYLDSNIYNLDNNQRSVFLSLANQVITRLAENMSKCPNSNKVLDLFSWLSGRCFENLYSGASFARRSIALKLLETMQKDNVWCLETCNPEQKYLIFTYLSDSYEENRIAAKRLIQTASFPSGFLNEEQLQVLYTNIVEMISGARFCEHSTAVYSLELFLHQSAWGRVYKNCFASLDGVSVDLSSVDEEVVCRFNNRYYYPLSALAEVLDNRLRSQDQDECLSTRPVYGFLVLAKRLFELVRTKFLEESSTDRWRELIVKFSHLCMKFNRLSTTVVSQSSPEGYLPQDELELVLEDSDSCYSLSQRLLLVSWRTVREASLMLSFFVEKFSFLATEDSVPIFVDDELVLEIGAHLKSLIRGIKHRGAFEQVYIALCQYCRACWRCSKNKTISNLPQKWLEDLAFGIEIGEGSEELCSLRRSAGVPYIAQAILSTEYDGNIRKRGTSQALDAFVNKLLDIFGRETNVSRTRVKESKIHAANILRALFRNKDLDEQMSSYVERGLVLALQGVRSPFWNERNVSWLLFSSLMTKIFGVARCKREISAKNKMTVKMFFRKYPSLYTVFQKQLQTVGESETSEASTRSSLYPILLIFQRLEVHSGCSREHSDTFELDSFIPLLFECTRSPVWKIRELVVSAIFPFVTVDIYEKYISALWSRVLLGLPENFLHGVLLQLERFLENVSTLGPEFLVQIQPLILDMLDQSVPLLPEYVLERSDAVGRQLLIVITWLAKLSPEQSDTFVEDWRNRFLSLLASRLEEALFTIREYDYFPKGVDAVDLMAARVCLLAHHRENLAISFIEDCIENEMLKTFPSEVILESICCFVSEDDEFVPLNTVLRNMPNMTELDRKNARESSILFHSYVGKRILHESSECNSLLLKWKILLGFIRSPTWVKQRFKCNLYVKKLLEVRDVLDEDSLHVVVRFLKKLHEFSWAPKNARFETLDLLIDHLLGTYSEDVAKLLVEFFFRCCHSITWQDHPELAVLRLNAWSLIIRYALSSSCHFVGDKLKMFPSGKVSPSSIEFIFQAFHVEIKYEYLLAAVAYSSWILRYFGILCIDEDASTIFVQNMPHFLEDDIIVSRLASRYLERVLNNKSDVLRSPLSEELSHWIGQQAAIEGHNFSSLNEVFEFATSEYVKRTTRNAESNSLLRADSWKLTLLANKMRFLSDLGVIKTTPD